MFNFLLFSLVLIVKSEDCSLFQQDYTKLVGKKSEIIQNEATVYFKQIKFGDTVTLQDQNKKLTLIPPIQFISSYQSAMDFKSITSFTVLKNVYEQWINQFRLLAIFSGQYFSVGSNQQQGNQQRLPVFSSYYGLSKITDEICYEQSMIDKTHFLIDCSNLTNQEESPNYLYLIEETTESFNKIKIVTDYPYDTNQQRILRSSSNMIYRGTPFTNNNPSIIQVYLYYSNNQTIELLKTIDEQFMKIAYQDIPDYKFELQGIQVSSDGLLSILDSAGRITTISYNGKGGWAITAILNQTSTCQTFDSNFLKNHYAVICNQNLILYNGQKITYNSQKDLTNYNVKFLKDFIILYSETEIMQFDNNLQLLYSQQGNFTNVIGDLTQNEFVMMNGKYTSRYQLFQTYIIQYQNEDSAIQTGIGVLSLNDCDVKIEYQLITDILDIIQVSKGQIFNFPIFDYSTNEVAYLKKYVNGPSIQLDFQPVSTEGKIVTFSSYPNRTLIDTSIQYENLIFYKTVSSSSSYASSYYYIITQDVKLNLAIYSCYELFQQYCTQQQDITLKIALTDKNTLIQVLLSSSLYISILKSSTELSVYKFITVGLYDLKNYEMQEEYEITSFYSTYQYLLLFSQTLQQIRVYYFPDMTFCYIINENAINLLGYKDWNVNKLFTSSIDNYLYIQNNNEYLFIVNLILSDFYVNEYIRIRQTQDNDIASYTNHFVLAQLELNDAIYIYVYNKKYQNWIYLEKTIPLYNVRILNLNDIQYNYEKGMMFVKARQNIDAKDILLTYIITETNHNSLYSQSELINGVQYINTVKNYLFQVNSTSAQITYFYDYPLIYTQADFTDNTYVLDLEYKLMFTGLNLPLSIDQKFRVINTQTKITTKNRWYEHYKITLPSNQVTNYTSTIEDWATGQITNYKMDFLPTGMTLFNAIEKVSYYSHNDLNNTKDSRQLNDDYFIVLFENTYIIEGEKLFYLKELNTELSCHKIIDILTLENKYNIFLQCSNNGQNNTVVIQCTQKFDCVGYPDYLKIDNDLISGKVKESQIILIFQQKVEFYTFTSVDKLSEATLVGSEDFSQLDFYAQGIQVQYISTDFYHIYCTDMDQNLYILEYQITKNQFNRKNQLAFSVYELINQNFYISKSYYLTHIEVINIQASQNNFKADYIMFASIGAHYGIHLEFEFNNYVSKLNTKTINFIIQGYEQWVLYDFMYPSIRIEKQYFTLTYTNDNTLALLVVKLPDTFSKKQSITIIGGLSPLFYFSQWKVQSTICKLNNEPYLLSNINTESKLMKYKISEHPYFLFDGEFYTTSRILTIKNDIYDEIVNVDIDIQQSSSGGLLGLWIFLGILGVGLAGGVGYYFYKRKQRKTEVLL